MGSASSSASAASSLHMAMAALVGSSIMAVSAFYIHKRTVDQVLHRLTELRRNVGSRSYIQRTDDDEEEVEDEEEEEEDGEFDDEAEFGSDDDLVAGRKIGGRGFLRFVDEKFAPNYRMSSSLPNVALANRDWVQDGSNSGRGSNFRAHGFSSSLDKLNPMPFGLPPLRTDQRHGGDLRRRVGSVDRLAVLTPRSQAGNAFDITGDSDEEGTELANEDDDFFNDEDAEASFSSMSVCECDF